ncbi:MAG: hypothetical protein AB7G11_10450 [Phycisphaerales bacterium]
MSAAAGQPLDFRVVSLDVCNVGTDQFRLGFDLQYTPDFGMNPPEIQVPVLISITSPGGTVEDEQICRWFKPANPGTCSGTDPCTGTCESWILRVTKGTQSQDVTVEAICIPTTANCQCSPGPTPKITKEKPKTDGPDAIYIVTVMIDPFNQYSEFSEDNNVITVQVGPNTAPCPAAPIPALSTWGLLAVAVMVPIGGIVVLRRRLGA